MLLPMLDRRRALFHDNPESQRTRWAIKDLSTSNLVGEQANMKKLPLHLSDEAGSMGICRKPTA